MTDPTSKTLPPLPAGFRQAACLARIGLGVLGLLAGAGCATPAPNPARPREQLVTVKAHLGWQRSGVMARRGRVIHCASTGRWGDSFADFGADGNPESWKSHFGVLAPANGLIMRLSTQTNRVYFVGLDTNVTAEQAGEILFRNNVSLPDGQRGELKVRVSVGPDADGDGVSDYDELFVWKTDPLRADTDGDRFPDLDEINDLRGILVPPAAAGPPGPAGRPPG